MHHFGSPGQQHEAAGHGAMPMSISAPATAQPAADAGEQEQPIPAGIDGLLHLCMAVLCAAVGLALALRLLRAHRHWVPRLSSEAIRLAPPRLPPRAWGRDVLHTVCVLRV